MSPTQEMLISLLTKETLDKVNKQFINSGTSIIHFEIDGLGYRLFKPTETNINLEFLNTMPFGFSETQNIPGIGIGRTGKSIMYYLPIGYFTQSIGNHEFTVVKAFENDMDYLINNNKISMPIKINKLSLEENALLAAFSIESAARAEKYEDASYTANGLFCDIYMCSDGFPQVFLDDRHGLRGPIAAYLIREENMVKPITTYKKLFDKFNSMGLLTAFKKLGSQEIKNTNTGIGDWVHKVFNGSLFNSGIYDDSESLEELKRKGYPYSMASFDINNDTSIAIGMERGNQTPRDFMNENQNNNFILDMSIPKKTILTMRGKRIVYYAKKV